MSGMVEENVRDQQESDSVATLDKLGYLPSQIDEIERFVRGGGGLIVVGGAVGSGKRTTAHSIARLAKNMGVGRVAWHDEARDPLSLAHMLGVAAGMAKSGERGILLTTAHAYGAVEIIERLDTSVDKVLPGGISELLFCGAFNALLIHQALLPVLCPHCSVKGPADQSERSKWQSMAQQILQAQAVDTSGVATRHRAGCEHCTTGLVRMQAVAEVVTASTPLVAEYRAGGVRQARVLLKRRSDGRPDSPDMTGKRVADHALYLALQGKVDANTAMSVWAD
jgi:type II secretory ATPase GspE/PulE/Tfp pilus assembly ATPase PilB-like protein